MRSSLASFLVASLVVLQFLIFAPAARAQQTPFPNCSPQVYLAQNSPTQLFRVSTTTNPFTYPAVGPASGVTYNAIAYRPADNFIYGVNRQPGENIQLLRIGAGGGVQVMGDITGGNINARPGAPNSGEIGADGFYYLKFTDTNPVIYRVNIATRVATAITMSQGRASADLAWYNGLLYAHDNNVLYTINPSNGQVTVKGPSTQTFGGMVSASNGIFGVNNTGGFFQINPANGATTLISGSPVSGNNDAAKCFSSALQFGADLSITKTDNKTFYLPGTTATYSIVVRNNGPFGVQGALVNDPLPTGITAATWTCGAATGGGVCGTASGSGAIVNRSVNLPAGATVTFTMKLQIPAGRTGVLTNTATVTPPATALDSNMANNTATDSDAFVTVAKQLLSESGSIDGFAEPGENLTYRITLTNPTTVAATAFGVTDTLDPNTSFVSATVNGVSAGSNVTWSGLGVPAGGSLNLNVVVAVKSPLPAGLTQIRNIAKATGGVTPTCPSAQCVTTPVAPEVTYSKSTNATNAEIGDVISYTLSARVMHSATQAVVTLTDTLGAGLDFTAVTSAGAFTCNAGSPLTCTLPVGTAPGLYTLTYAATVNPSAAGAVTNAVVGTGATCSGTCNTSTTLVASDIIYSKSASTAGPVSPGDVITYTLTTTVKNAKTTGDTVLLTDTLGTGLDFTAVLSPGAYTVDDSGAPIVRFTLPAGTGPGVYPVTYTATVNDQASGTVANAVVGSGTDQPTCTTGCGTTTKVAEAGVTYQKSVSAPAATVKVGDVLTYTLTATIINSASTGALTLTDTLGDGLDFTAVTSAGAFTCNAASPLVCTLPAGRAPGAYSLTYTATVNASASGAVTNAVIGTGPDEPTCGASCTTSTPLEGAAATYHKSVSAPAAEVKAGDVLTYSLTATVAGSALTDDLILTDTLGAGLDFTAVTSEGAFTCEGGGPLVCTLPAGTAPGTYSLTYTASISASASGAVTNAVVGTGGGNPTCDATCNTSTTVTEPAVTFTKTANTAGPVQAGDVITYTVTTTVKNSVTTGDTVLLTDTLGAGLDFTAVTSAGAYTVDASGAPVVRFTLPAGTGPGTYPVTYTATVNAQAKTSVTNAVVGSGPDEPTCTICGTETPVDGPAVTYGKSVSAPGAEVEAGDVLTYTLTATVTKAPTTGVLTLTDTLGPGLDFTAVTSAGPFTCNAASPLVCTLPAGTAPGTYSLTYTATVNAAAEGAVTNAVVGTGTDGPTCETTCSTSTTVVEPDVHFAKTASTAGPVRVGDVITYTLTTTVANAKTTGDTVLLTDTLGTGLDFTAVTSAGAYTVDASTAPVVRFTLPAGTGPGTYAVVYTATVNDQAGNEVSNAVVGSGPDKPTCTNACGTTTPVGPGVTYKKSVSAAAVEIGDVVTYTLTATVANSPTTDVVALTDTLGAGLDFTAVTSAGAFTCNGASPLTCTLPAGTAPGVYSISYTATVNASATGSVTNAVVGSGVDGPTCDGTCNTTTILVAPDVVFAKTASTAGPVKASDVITYTLTTTVKNAKTTGDTVLLTDTLGAGLDFTAVTSAGAYTVDASGAPVVRFTLPAGTGPGVYPVTYTATVNDQASKTVANAVVGSGTDQPTCTTACGTETKVAEPVVGYRKTVSAPASVEVGDVLTYTLTETVADAPTTSVVTLTDTMGAGLDFVAVTSAGAFTCNGASPLVCTLPAGTAPGAYSLTYTAKVNASANGSVTNAVVGTGIDKPTCDGGCNTSNIVAAPSVTYSKKADVTGPVKPGDVITYTLTTTVANAKTTSDTVLLTDTLGVGLDFTAVTSAGAYGVDASGAPVVRFTLPAGAAPGTYAVSYTATVNAQAKDTVLNAVVASGPDKPTCAGACETSSIVAAPDVVYAKTASTAGPVKAGEVIAYTLTATVSDAATTDVVTLTDTLGAGLDFTAVTSAGAFTCNAASPLVCTLPAGAEPGAYSVTYTATVNGQASGTVDNAVVGTGVDNPHCVENCGTSTTVAAPVIRLSKTSDPAPGGTVRIGDTINYALVATVTDAATTEPLVLVDTPDRGLTITSLPAGCVAGGATVTCTLPAGTPVGVHRLAYSAMINENAGETVRNLVTGTGGGGASAPECVDCAVELTVDLMQIRLVKTAAVRQVKIGDLVRYTLSVENVGERDLVDGGVIDTPPAGFTYVEGSLRVVDGDNAATISGQRPVRFQGIDVQVGKTATLTYLMRVGAGVRGGVHTNQAQTVSVDERPVSNAATAQVELVGDPLIDDTLIFGTVFDDRDGDGWQDSAALSGLKVQGGFAPEAYVAGSTAIDRGEGMGGDPNASLPNGLKLGDLGARQSEADGAGSHRIVIRQKLSSPTFTDDFVLTSAQGVTVRMDAEGRTRIEKGGEAAKGLNQAEPRVERRIAQAEGGYVVDYVIENEGVDERGIPGVRIASVEGLIVETDQFGRYHLEGVPGGDAQRGRNFILKVDPATLPAGAVFTTDNPLLRRTTPGLPVRFDWGVKLPVALIEGRAEEVELDLGRVIFAPGSAEVDDRYRPVIDKMAETVRQHRGGQVVIDANGEEALARANAVRTALLAKVEPEAARNLTVVARAKADDPASMLVGVDEGGALLGTVLFDTDKSDIRPEFAPVLDKVAAWIVQQDGGVVTIVGHTDVRASFDYNTALGMRRARAVYDALAARVPPNIRARVRVESDPTPPANEQRR
ncbi:MULTISPECIES: isopeptide-forming domain-containing fimbrial protein [Phenylobacterium]|uniref:Repeat protein (TIGR01451 family)/fimbrial isopeptide formation D2 family protein n=1 Tax=Phenylobacterium koreense TaxID=266125 RepID=A0ABV2EHN3_9CAUL